MLLSLKIAALVACVSAAAGTGFYLWQASTVPVVASNHPCDLALAERIEGVMSQSVMGAIEDCVAAGYFTARQVQIALKNR